MKKLQCELCGGIDIVKEGDFFVCQHCGCKYTKEDAQKIILGGPVKVDNTEKIQNLYTLARRARISEYYNEQTYKHYSELLVLDPNSWEAMFYCAFYDFCRKVQGMIQQNEYDDAIIDSFRNTFSVGTELVKHISEEEKKDVCTELLKSIDNLMTAFLKIAIDNAFFNRHRYVTYIADLYDKTIDFSSDISNDADLAISTLEKAEEKFCRYLKYKPNGIDDANEQLWLNMKYEIQRELPKLEGKRDKIRAKRLNVSVYDIARFDNLKVEKKELESELWKAQFEKPSLFSKMFSKKNDVEAIKAKLERVTKELDSLTEKMS